MTVDNDDARAADAQQAQSLRSDLVAERRRLVDKITERGDLVRNGYSTSRIIAELHRAEAELLQLDGMVERLDRRFASQ